LARKSCSARNGPTRRVVRMFAAARGGFAVKNRDSSACAEGGHRPALSRAVALAGRPDRRLRLRGRAAGMPATRIAAAMFPPAEQPGFCGGRRRGRRRRARRRSPAACC
jgi:hypothetical protein